MAINETIVTGRKFRKLVDEAAKQWQRISFWTKASDVEFDDGSTLQQKIGTMSGITDSLTSESSDTVLSAKAGKSLQDQINSLQAQIDAINNKLGTQVTFSVDGTTLTITPR